MIEDTVEQNANAVLFACGDQPIEGFSAPEHGIYLHIIARVVFMIGVCLENRAEVQDGYAE